MALDESTEGLDELSSNNITAYIDPKLKEYLSQLGDIRIDFITNVHGSGYAITVGESKCGQGGCNCDQAS
jgi:Fe-S cluster assembly iron-binding protein IscA